MTAAHLKGPVVHWAWRLGCSNKIAYGTRKEATTSMQRGAKPIPGKPYRCRKCDRWHITTGREWEGVGKP